MILDEQALSGPIERYEVWVEDRDGKRPQSVGQSWLQEFAEGLKREYQDEENTNARMEMRRPNRRFFLVRVITTREEVGR